ncbi:unnamed protein product [Echinostoma caproni]|uniref:Protein kinase domain-containing protein n=1 Tax=Echinostoma caproni TaxID=27848 RepID=A0A183A890_9TREM|nr:unnamed protein product [Echinostoma caproni]
MHSSVRSNHLMEQLDHAETGNTLTSSMKVYISVVGSFSTLIRVHQSSGWMGELMTLMVEWCLPLNTGGSVGVLTYFLLTGVSPFLAEEKEITMQNVTHGTIRFPEELFATRSPEAIHFVQSLLIRKPSVRLTADQCLQHPWLRSVRDSAIDLASISSCSEVENFASFTDDSAHFSGNQSDTELKPMECSGYTEDDCSLVPYHRSSENCSTQITPWSFVNKGTFASVTVHVNHSHPTTSVNFHRLSSFTPIEMNYIRINQLRSMFQGKNLNPVLLHLPIMSLDNIEQTKPHCEKRLPALSVGSRAIVNVDGSQVKHFAGQTDKPSVLPNQSTDSHVNSKDATYCVEIQVNIAPPTAQNLALATEHACSALIYMPGSNSSILGRKSYSVFRGLDNGTRPLRTNWALLNNNRMSASLDSIYMASVTSLLSFPHTSVASSKSHHRKLIRTGLGWTDVNEQNRAKRKSEHHLLRLPSVPCLRNLTDSPVNYSMTFSHVVRSLRDTLSRAARFVSSPSIWSFSGLHKPRNTRA